MNVGDNIRRLREAENLSQTELAEEVGVTSSMMSQIERGTKVPTILLAVDIAKALGCSLYDLVA